MTDAPAADEAIDAHLMEDAPSTAVVRTTSSLDARIRYARELTMADNLLPAAFRNNPGKVLLAIETGGMLGIHPVAALNGVHVIEGKPTISAGLMGALVRRAGHRLRVTTEGSFDAGDLAAIAEIVRADDPEFTFRQRWDLDRARRAGLLGKGVWKSYPEAMLKARAISEVCREAAEDCLMGVHYTPEELGAVVDEDGVATVEATLVPEPEKPAEPSPEAFAATAFRVAAACKSIAELEAFIRDDLPRRVASRSWAKDYADMAAYASTVKVDTRSGPRSLLDAVAIVERHLRGQEGGDATGGQDGRQDPPSSPGTGDATPAPGSASQYGDVDPWADGGASGSRYVPPPAAREDESDVVDAEVVDEAPTPAPAAEAVPAVKSPSHEEAVGNVVRGMGGGEVVDATDRATLATSARAAANARDDDRDDPAADQGHRPPADPPADGTGSPESLTGRAAWDAAKENLAKLREDGK